MVDFSERTTIRPTESLGPIQKAFQFQRSSYEESDKRFGEIKCEMGEEEEGENATERGWEGVERQKV